jgi:hypothetical protein
VKLTKARRAELEAEAAIALRVLEPAASRFELEVVGDARTDRASPTAS